MVGTGRGAQSGILFRNAQALEHAQRITTLVLDKTGTLTQGTPVVATPPYKRLLQPKCFGQLSARLKAIPNIQLLAHWLIMPTAEYRIKSCAKY